MDKERKKALIGQNKYLFIDGYNVINAWDELQKTSRHSLEDARRQLIEYLVEYSAYSKEKVIVVFDAYTVKGKKPKNEKYQGIEIVFTKERQTADSYIEIEVDRIAKDIRNAVRVVTSDWAEQQVILGSGGTRVTPLELKMDIERIRQKIQRDFTKEVIAKDTVENALGSDVIKKLKDIFS